MYVNPNNDFLLFAAFWSVKHITERVYNWGVFCSPNTFTCVRVTTVSCIEYRDKKSSHPRTGSVLFAGSLDKNKKGKNPKKRKQMQPPHLRMGKLQYITFMFLGLDTL